VTRVPMAVVCRSLKVARSTGYLRVRPRQGRFYRQAEDTEVLYEILGVTRQRASYGVRRAARVLLRYGVAVPRRALAARTPRAANCVRRA
jgi:hypothetical protein